jgi:DNA replicative helicase MCM subunit Mcm2 (Cdc46/Mcm family)
VTQPDVDQAIRLMDYSIRSLRNLKDDGKDSKRKKHQEKDSRQDQMSKIIDDIRAMMNQQNVDKLKINDIWKNF